MKKMHQSMKIKQKVFLSSVLCLIGKAHFGLSERVCIHLQVRVA